MPKNEYVITIINEGGGKEEAKTMASSEKTDTSASTPSDNKSPIKAMALVGYAENLANKYISHKINTINLRTGHVELQEKMQFIHGTVKRGLDVTKFIAGGGLLAGSGGALVGAALGIGSQLVDYSIKLNELQMKRELENMTIALNNIRMGTRQDRTNRSI